MEPEFPNPNNQLGGQQRGFARKKDRGAKPQLQFIMMTQRNDDPLGRQGRPDPMTLDDVAPHNTPGDTWIVIENKVYDVSAYIEYHPGGNIITKAAGKDGTNFFRRYHPWVNIENLLGKYQVGYLSSIS